MVSTQKAPKMKHAQYDLSRVGRGCRVVYGRGMEAPHVFLQALAVVLGVAALTTVLFQKLKQPVVLGYMIAGLLVGPHIPVPLVANVEVVETLSELGVILLMFSLGLEFSFRKLAKLGLGSVGIAIIEMSLTFWFGYMAAQWLGWSSLQSLFLAAVTSISSTTIIAKAFGELGVDAHLKDTVVSTLVMEDLFAIVLMTMLSALGTGQRLGPDAFATIGVEFVTFIAIVVAVGLAVVPAFMKTVYRLHRSEAVVVSSVGLCFAVSLLASSFGYSMALGAFMAGTLIAEAGDAKRVERLIHPIRDLFVAVFFVSIGMSVAPATVVAHWQLILMLCLIVILGKMITVSKASFLMGNGLKTSIQAGMSMGQVGEFSLIVAGLGHKLGVTPAYFFPVVAVVSAVTTLTTPWMLRFSQPLVTWIEERLPHGVQTYMALYSNWFEHLRLERRITGHKLAIRRCIKWLIADAVALVLCVVVASWLQDRVVAWGAQNMGIHTALAHSIYSWLVVCTVAPFCFGIVHLSQNLGRLWARLALPSQEEQALTDASRHVLKRSLELVVLLIVGLPLAVLTQPFLHNAQGMAVLLIVVAGLGISFLRSAHALDNKVRAGTQTLLSLIVPSGANLDHELSAEAKSQQTRSLLSALGEPIYVPISANASVVGKSLAELHLRSLTGAVVLAIVRNDHPRLMPGADERLLAGDVVALAGSHSAVEKARALLHATDLVQ